MTRLSLSTCKTLPYEPAFVDIGIVHLGVGAFHRAHMADYTDAVLAKGDRRWAILGASLRAPAKMFHAHLRAALAARA